MSKKVAGFKLYDKLEMKEQTTYRLQRQRQTILYTLRYEGCAGIGKKVTAKEWNTLSNYIDSLETELMKRGIKSKDFLPI